MVLCVAVMTMVWRRLEVVDDVIAAPMKAGVEIVAMSALGAEVAAWSGS